MKLKKTILLTVAMLQAAISLTACVATPLSTAEDKSEAKENNVQTENDDVVDDTLHISDVLSRSKELSFNEVLTGLDGEINLNNATVNIGNIENIGLYEYKVLPITDDFRKSLFTSVLGDKAADAEYDARNDVWELQLSNKVGDYYLYETGYFLAGESVAEQITFSLEYRYVDLYPYPQSNNLL